MGKDEAFIRSIVTNPGVDAPRLAYAEWLDGRDDPRGPYLRAEQNWAQKRIRKGSHRGVAFKHAPRRLSTLASSLDPVWVARISRPPLGVCCDHLRFIRRKGSSIDELKKLEALLGVSLPPQYTAFRMNYPECFRVPDGFDPDDTFPYPQLLDPRFFANPVFVAGPHRLAAFGNPYCHPTAEYDWDDCLLVGLSPTVADRIYCYDLKWQTVGTEGRATRIRPVEVATSEGTLAEYLWALPSYETQARA